MTYYCCCGNVIADERVKAAFRCHKTPTYCSNSCRDKTRSARVYAKKQRRAFETGLPLKAITLSDGQDATPISRTVSLDPDVRVIILEASRTYRQKGAHRGRTTALL